MKKIELVREISKVSGSTQKEVAAVLDAIGEVVVNTLAANKDEKISIPNVGAFVAKFEPAREGVSALDGKTWKHDDRYSIQFKMSPATKKALY